MTTVALILAVLAFLNIAAFLLYNYRTQRLLNKYKNFTRGEIETTFRRIETRIIRGAADFQEADHPSKAWAVMFTRDRHSLAMHTLQSLRLHEPALPILVIDNGSSDGTHETLLKMMEKKELQKLLFNTHSDVPQWQKSFAIAQALKLLALERPQWIVWLDDDLEITRPFLQNAISAYAQLTQENVKVITLMDDSDQEQNHPTRKRVLLQLPGGTEDIKLRDTFNGAFNLFAADFFREFGYPPIAEGINELGSEDWFYSRQLQSRGYRAAVLPSANHLGTHNSKRIEMSA